MEKAYNENLELAPYELQVLSKRWIIPKVNDL